MHTFCDDTAYNNTPHGMMKEENVLISSDSASVSTGIVISSDNYFLSREGKKL